MQRSQSGSKRIIVQETQLYQTSSQKCYKNKWSDTALPSMPYSTRRRCGSQGLAKAMSQLQLMEIHEDIVWLGSPMWRVRRCFEDSRLFQKMRLMRELWLRAVYRTFQVRKQSVQRARLELLERAAEAGREVIPTAALQKVVTTTTDDQGSTLVASRKFELSKRGLGRPHQMISETTAVLNTLISMNAEAPASQNIRRKEKDGKKIFRQIS